MLLGEVLWSRIMKSTKRIREQAASVVDSGGVEYLVLGGGSCGFGCYSNEVEILRFDTLSWHAVAPVPTLSQPRVDGAGGGVGGKAVFYAGLFGNGLWSTTMDIFDSNNNFARSTVALSTERLKSVLIPFGDRYMMVAGGARSMADYYSTVVDVVDVLGETVTYDAYRLPQGVQNHCGATDRSYLYVVGGTTSLSVSVSNVSVFALPGTSAATGTTNEPGAATTAFAPATTMSLHNGTTGVLLTGTTEGSPGTTAEPRKIPVPGSTMQSAEVTSDEGDSVLIISVLTALGCLVALAAGIFIVLLLRLRRGAQTTVELSELDTERENASKKTQKNVSENYGKTPKHVGENYGETPSGVGEEYAKTPTGVGVKPGKTQNSAHKEYAKELVMGPARNT
jgi:hypothetical protein